MLKTIAKNALAVIFLGFTSASAIADLQLSITADYPGHINLKIPVQENSDFKINTAFGNGEFFDATGHVSQITGTNRSYSLTYGYEFNLTNGCKGSATGSASGGLHDIYDQNIFTGGFDPDFKLEEVPVPVRPVIELTNVFVVTNTSVMPGTSGADF